MAERKGFQGHFGYLTVIPTVPRKPDLPRPASNFIHGLQSLSRHRRPRISHRREADNGASKISSTSQSNASHHNWGVLLELTSTMGMEFEIYLTCSTRSVQL